MYVVFMHSATHTKLRKHKRMNLQEALLLKKKDLLRTSEARLSALHQAKDARILRNSKQTAWLEEIASQTPRSRRLAEPSFTPVPVVRAFSHRDIVRATREKCNDLNMKHETECQDVQEAATEPLRVHYPLFNGGKFVILTDLVNK